MTRPSIAFVVQRSGSDVVGGGESLCLQVAQHLAPFADVEVLSTCARDYMTWRNYYEPGHAIVNDVHVQRFPVDFERHVKRFDALSQRMRDNGQAPHSDEESWMRAQGPYSTALQNYVRVHAPRFDRFAFFGYLYASTYFTLPLVSDKAVLWPLAHDEWPLQFSIWDDFFGLPQSLVFNTLEEQQVVARRFPGLKTAGEVVATGILAPPAADGEAFRSRHGINGPFVLYLGRLDREKGCQVLFDFFSRYHATDPLGRKLVVIGDGPLGVPEDAGIVALGRVDEPSKWGALAAADAVIVPSALESLSLTVLESWASGRPVLVNAASPVLVGQCRRANGGLWYSSYDEFAAALSLLTPQLGARLGEQGRAFVGRHFVWDAAVEAYRRILGC